MSDQALSAETRWTEEFLISMRQESDRIPEQIVEQIVEQEGEGAARWLFKTLISQVDLPRSEFPDFAQSYFEKTDEVPDWVDPERVLNGQKVFAEHGPPHAGLFVLLILAHPLLGRNGYPGIGTYRSTDQ